MLGKLCKHELRATARWFLPLFLIILVLAPITRLGLYIYDDLPRFLQFIPNIIVFTFVCMLIVLSVASVLLIIYRFYKNMVTDEGYLTHTLPVTPAAHIWSKLIIAALWMTASFFVIFLALFILFINVTDFSNAWNEFSDVLHVCFTEGIGGITAGQFTLLITELFIVLVISVFFAPLMFYASIAIGQLFTSHKVAGSFAGYFVINTVFQILAVLAFFPSIAKMSQMTLPTFSSMNLFFIITIVLSCIMPVTLFIITNLIFKKKLNLE